MLMNKSKLKFYNKNGFVIIKNLLSKTNIKKLQKTILNRSKNYFNNKKNFLSIYDKVSFKFNKFKKK